MRYDFVVFDYDGVIIDSVPAVTESVRILHSRLGVHSSVADVNAWLGPNIAEAVRAFRHSLGLGPEYQESLESDYFDAYTSVAARLTKAFPGMIALLSDISTREIPRVLATMKARSEFDAIGSPLPGAVLFDFVSCPTTHLGGWSKKDLVGDAVRHINDTAPNATAGVLIGDRASDIEAGREHGLQTVAVLWGAGSSDELISARPDEIVANVHDLRTVLAL